MKTNILRTKEKVLGTKMKLKLQKNKRDASFDVIEKTRNGSVVHEFTFIVHHKDSQCLVSFFSGNGEGIFNRSELILCYVCDIE
jgi:N-acetylmuramoyl-L-alanine amidase